MKDGYREPDARCSHGNLVDLCAKCISTPTQAARDADVRRAAEFGADRRAKSQCTTGNDKLDAAVQWYLRVGFEDGFLAGYARGQAKMMDAIAIAEEALEDIDKYWDASDPGCVVPTWHPGELAPNDSLAAGSIQTAKWALARIRAADHKIG